MDTSATPSHTLRNVRRDFVEWHLGRPDYALWALDVDTTALLPRMAAARVHLAPWLLGDYRRQPHITLGLCGFPSLAPQRPDEFGPAQLRAQLAALRQARLQPFAITVGGLATFSSVPYLTVDDGGGHLPGLRVCLNEGTSPEPYVPHVTVGLYADAWPLAAVLPRLAAFADTAALRLPVRGLCLLSYAAADIGGPLQCLGRYAFASGSWQCDAHGAWGAVPAWHGDCCATE